MHTLTISKSERELVLRLIDGDEDAFCKLYTAYKGRLLLFALKFLKSPDYAEDVLQDVFTNIWMGRTMINPEIPFSAYLFTIVKNRVLNLLRDLEKQQLLREQIFLQGTAYTSDTQDEILSEDLKSVIQKALQAMTPRQREIFTLSRKCNLTYKEIAERLDISVHTVNEHLSSSLHIIRNYLVKYSDERLELILLLFYLNN